jgi:hypothetical protein
MPSVISAKALLSLYLTVPLTWLLVLFDYTNDNAVMLALPERPEFWWIWIYIFGMPHVFASYIILADKDYWAEFKGKLIKGMAVLLLLPPIIMAVLGYQWLFFIFTVMIIYHTIAQQYGLSLIISRTRPDRWHRINTIVGSFIGVILYTLIYADTYTILTILPYLDSIYNLIYMMAFVLIVVAIRQIMVSKTLIGKWYTFATMSMILTMIGLFFYGLPILAIIMGRVIHEFSAWLIYSSHDKNRNHEVRHNLIYAKLAWLKIDPYFLGIILAFLSGIAVTYVSQSNQNFLALLIVSFSLYHYWMEGVIWKGNSLPKQHLLFK